MKKYNAESLKINKDGKFEFYRDIKQTYNENMAVYNNHPRISKEFILGEMLVIEKGNKVYMIPSDLDGIKLTDEYLLSNYATYKVEIPEFKTFINTKGANVIIENSKFTPVSRFGFLDSLKLKNIRDFTADIARIAELSNKVTQSTEFGDLIDFVEILQSKRVKTKGGVNVRK